MPNEKAKKYFWFKMPANFFELDEIDLLSQEKNGSVLIHFYLLLFLHTINKDGVLSYELRGEEIAYTNDRLRRISKELFTDVNEVEKAMEKLYNLGLLNKREKSGIFYIENHYKMVGGKQYETDKRNQQNAIKRIEEKEKYFEDKNVNDFFIKYLYMRAEEQMPTNEIKIQDLKKELQNLSNNDNEIMISIINDATLHKWQKFYYDKPKNNKPKNNNPISKETNEKFKEYNI